MKALMNFLTSGVTNSRHIRWWSSWNCVWGPLGLCWSHRVCC